MKRKDLFFLLVAFIVLAGCAQQTPVVATQPAPTNESPTQLPGSTEQPTYTPEPATQPATTSPTSEPATLQPETFNPPLLPHIQLYP